MGKGKNKVAAKLPKALRKPGRLIAAIAASPFAREVVASALVAAAAALTGDERVKAEAKKGAQKAGTALGGAADKAAEVAADATGNGAKQPKRHRAKPAAAAR